MKKKPEYLDDEEKELMASLDKGEWKSDLTPKLKTMYRQYAENSMSKTKRINIRMNDRDFHKIQSKAMQEGLPYQSLISMLIHKFNEGKLVVR
jgi:predicted DNA binding CopG/RHH family protein